MGLYLAYSCNVKQSNGHLKIHVSNEAGEEAVYANRPLASRSLVTYRNSKRYFSRRFREQPLGKALGGFFAPPLGAQGHHEEDPQNQSY